MSDIEKKVHQIKYGTNAERLSATRDLSQLGPDGKRAAIKAPCGKSLIPGEYRAWTGPELGLELLLLGQQATELLPRGLLYDVVDRGAGPLYCMGYEKEEWAAALLEIWRRQGFSTDAAKLYALSLKLQGPWIIIGQSRTLRDATATRALAEIESATTNVCVTCKSKDVSFRCRSCGKVACKRCQPDQYGSPYSGAADFGISDVLYDKHCFWCGNNMVRI
jgi:predicted RNA-binding Zn-ribbon protein involved in translation (DUF1610 family)